MVGARFSILSASWTSYPNDLLRPVSSSSRRIYLPDTSTLNIIIQNASSDIEAITGLPSFSHRPRPSQSHDRCGIFCQNQLARCSRATTQQACITEYLRFIPFLGVRYGSLLTQMWGAGVRTLRDNSWAWDCFLSQQSILLI